MTDPNERKEEEDAQEEAIERAAVGLIMAARAIFLKNGANALKHWGQLATRIKEAINTTATPENFASAFCVGLKIETSASPRLGNSILNFVASTSKYPRWHQVIRQRVPFLIALAQAEANRIKAEKEEIRPL